MLSEDGSVYQGMRNECTSDEYQWRSSSSSGVGVGRGIAAGDSGKAGAGD